MARDDLFRRSFEAGTAFLDMTRERAEALVKELVKAGELQKGKAQKAIDEMLERSRKGTEELRQLIRREIAEQVSAMGLATKEDLARLEARIGETSTSPAPAPEPTKAAGLKKAGPASKATPAAAKTDKAAPAAAKTEQAAPSAKAATKVPAAGGAKKAGSGKVAGTGPGKTIAEKAATKATSARKKAAGLGSSTPTGITASPPPDGV